jgi:hypothetical protein
VAISYRFFTTSLCRLQNAVGALKIGLAGVRAALLAPKVGFAGLRERFLVSKIDFAALRGHFSNPVSALGDFGGGVRLGLVGFLAAAIPVLPAHSPH